MNRRSRAVSTIAFVSVLLGAPSLVRAWSCSTLGCPDWCAAPAYSVGEVSSTLEAFAPGTSVSEIARGMGDWALVSCTSLSVSSAGTTTAKAVSGDGMNVVAFVSSGWEYDANIIGMTTHVLSSGCIVESDIVLNEVNYDFVTRPGYANEINAYSAILHEAGHFYGLGHSNQSSATMYYRYGSGTKVLVTDDQQGICYLYPGVDPPPDCSATGCPTGQACSNGVCVAAPPPACTSDYDCVSYQLCNLATGVCENKPATGTNLGTSCAVDTDCQSGLCQPTSDGAICSQTCDALNPHSCPSGFHCSGEIISDCAIGLCLPGGMGTGAFLSPCSAATDCASLYCSPTGVCSVPCERGVATSCPGGGYICHPADQAACGFCGDPSPLGDACQASDECASLVCYDADLDGRGVCATQCSVDSPCPEGFDCTPIGADSLCLRPPAGRLSGGGCEVSGGSTDLSVALLGLIGVTLAMGRATKRRCRPKL